MFVYLWQVFGWVFLNDLRGGSGGNESSIIDGFYLCERERGGGLIGTKCPFSHRFLMHITNAWTGRSDDSTTH